MQTILKFQNFCFFLRQQGIEHWTSRQEILRAANWARRFWNILLKVFTYTPENFEAGENFQFFIFYFDELS